MNIAIEGTVGVGKSTLAEILAREFSMNLFPENFENPYFDLFYKEPDKYAFPMHVQLFWQQFSHAKQAFDTNNAVLDRTIYAGQVFMKVLYQNGHVNPLDYENYLQMVNYFSRFCPIPDLLVFLTSSKETCVRRIMKRGRKPELRASIQYWYDLHDAYQEWYANYDYGPKIIIDVDQLDFANNLDHRRYVVKVIFDAMNQLGYQGLRRQA